VSTPRLEVYLDRIGHNARELVGRLGRRGIAVTGVTKATLGSPEVARELVHAGVAAIGDSRIENIERMRAAGVAAPMVLIRSPMLSQADRVVASAEVSLNTELDVLDRLSVAAGGRHRPHGVVLLVELGDLREGILPGDLDAVVRRTLAMPHITLLGIGTNLACQSGAAPDKRNMDELGALAGALETTFGLTLGTVSGGNSANLDWVESTDDVGRITDLRLGESILLGREPLQRRPIDGLHTDTIVLIGEVIESKVKPTRPWGDLHQNALGQHPTVVDRGDTSRVIVALGHQDVDPAGLTPPAGMTVLGASSDHLVIDAGAARPAVGSEIRFGLDYGALVRAMTSPFVTRYLIGGTEATRR
jgi:predicted amino acid racemase